MKFQPIPDSETTSCSEKQFEHLLRLVAVLQTSGSDTAAAAKHDEGPDGRYREDRASDQVARRAFQLFLQRGASHGWDMADWLQAEEEVRQKLEREQNIRRLALGWGLFKKPSEGANSLR